MKIEFEMALRTWRDKANIVGKREIFTLNPPLIENEYFIEIRQSINVNDGASKHLITSSRLFHTYAQNDQNLNSNGDLYLLNSILAGIEIDFQSKLQGFLDNLALEKTKELF